MNGNTKPRVIGIVGTDFILVNGKNTRFWIVSRIFENLSNETSFTKSEILNHCFLFEHKLVFKSQSLRKMMENYKREVLDRDDD